MTVPFELRDYQKEAVSWLASNRRTMLCDDPGLGKTASVIEALNACGEDISTLLIVGPKSAHNTWNVFLRYLDVKVGRVEIVTYQSLGKIKEKFWHTIIFDESHALRRKDAKTLYQTAKTFTGWRVWLITGTPLKGGGASDLWTSLNILDPHRFKSYWAFVNRFCFVIDNGYGKDVMGVRNGEELRILLSKYMLRRTFKKVYPELPGITREAIPLEMTAKQKRIYNELANDLAVELDRGGYLISANALTIGTRMRQLLTDPHLLGVDDDGAGIDALQDLLPDTEPGAIFSPFKKIDGDIAHATGRPTFAIHGDQTDRQREANVDGFNQAVDDGRNPLVVCSILSSTSFSLHERCRLGVFLGYDWDPTNNFQAEGRIFRPARGDHGRLVYYITHPGTIDDRVMEILDGKTSVNKVILDKYPRGNSKW